MDLTTLQNNSNDKVLSFLFKTVRCGEGGGHESIYIYIIFGWLCLHSKIQSGENL